jgi:Fe-Mn family superoxide dismutase
MDPIYRPKNFNLSGLHGISDRTLEMHFKLYQGYVEATNRLNEKAYELLRDGSVDADEMPAYSELKRRLGFEYNGMTLHEFYFGNLKRNGGGAAPSGGPLRRLAERCFGSYELWKTDFASVGKMRGVGWAVCYYDAANNCLNNHWIELHETNNVAGYTPVLVMDVWEHAYLLDYKPADRSRYIDAFFANVDWEAVDDRLRLPVHVA